MMYNKSLAIVAVAAIAAMLIAEDLERRSRLNIEEE